MIENERITVLGAGLSATFAVAAFYEHGYRNFLIVTDRVFPQFYGILIEHVPKMVERYLTPYPLEISFLGEESYEKYYLKRFKRIPQKFSRFTFRETQIYHPIHLQSLIMSLVKPKIIFTKIKFEDIEFYTQTSKYVIQTFPNPDQEREKFVFRAWTRIEPWKPDGKVYILHNTTDDSWYREIGNLGFKLREFVAEYEPTTEQLATEQWIKLKFLQPDIPSIDLQDSRQKNLLLVGRWARWNPNLFAETAYFEIKKFLEEEKTHEDR